MSGPRPAGSAASRRLPLLLLLIAGLVPLAWPGDVPFINDEPQLIANAVAANAAGHLATMGLQGTFGFAYGPLPTWIYQLLAALTHDLVALAGLRIALMSLATGGALWWLARSLGLWPGLAALPLLSPYYWMYAREIWDNTFLLPLTAAAVAGYAAFLRDRSPLGLHVCVGAMLAIPLVHLMGLSLVVPLAAHLIAVHHRALWHHRIGLAVVAGAALWAAWPYWMYLAAPQPPSPPHERVLAGWLFPLHGARLLGTRELGYFFGPEPVRGSWFAVGAWVSLIPYALAWSGIGVASATVVHAARTASWTARAHIATIAGAALACQSVVHGMSAKFEHPHYQNGTWIATVVLTWLAIDWGFRHRPPARTLTTVVVTLTAVVNLAVTATLAVRLHRSHGTRDVYGPTLANQQQVVRTLARYAPTSEVQTRVLMWERFPHTPAVLRQLNAARRIDLPRRVLRVEYASQRPGSGEIVVREVDGPR